MCRVAGRILGSSGLCQGVLEQDGPLPAAPAVRVVGVRGSPCGAARRRRRTAARLRPRFRGRMFPLCVSFPYVLVSAPNESQRVRVRAVLFIDASTGIPWALGIDLGILLFVGKPSTLITTDYPQSRAGTRLTSWLLEKPLVRCCVRLHSDVVKGPYGRG